MKNDNVSGKTTDIVFLHGGECGASLPTKSKQLSQEGGSRQIQSTNNVHCGDACKVWDSEDYLRAQQYLKWVFFFGLSRL